MDNLSDRLKELSKHMEDCATEIAMYCEECSDHAEELRGAAAIVNEWAESIKAGKE